MDDLVKRINALKEQVDLRRAEKISAEKRKQEIEKVLTDKGIELDKIDRILDTKKEELKEKEIKLIKKIEEAENVLRKSTKDN